MHIYGAQVQNSLRAALITETPMHKLHKNPVPANKPDRVFLLLMVHGDTGGKTPVRFARQLFCLVFMRTFLSSWIQYPLICCSEACTPAILLHRRSAEPRATSFKRSTGVGTDLLACDKQGADTLATNIAVGPDVPSLAPAVDGQHTRAGVCGGVLRRKHEAGRRDDGTRAVRLVDTMRCGMQRHQ